MTQAEERRETGEALSVAFWGFWPGFDPYAFFLPVLERALGCPLVLARSTSSHVHIRVDSVFVDRGLRDLVVRRLVRPRFPRISGALFPDRRPAANRTVWFTGENMRPPSQEYDAYLSFDLDPLNGSNIYCPLILQSVDWFGSLQQRDEKTPEFARLGSALSWESASTPRTDTDRFLSRARAACAFIGNPEPFRMRALSILKEYIPVEVFGNAVGRPCASKIDVSREYRYMICFENDIYPGYVTEKPLEAWASGCIPVWRGLDAAGVMNDQAYLNALDFRSIRELGERLSSMPDHKQADLYSKPILTEAQTLLERVIAELRLHLK